jgi:hypothetical protein
MIGATALEKGIGDGSSDGRDWVVWDRAGMLAWKYWISSDVGCLISDGTSLVIL